VRVRDFFHCDTTVYKKRLKTAVAAVLMPVIAVCIFCAANIIFNMRDDGDKGFAQFMLMLMAGCIAFAMAACFLGAYIADKKCRRHSRYTYFDILPKGMIYSRYAGEYYLYGERTVYRRLYYIPFEGFTDALRDPKESPRSLTVTGDIREYLLPSDYLGYHIDEDGELVFDYAELSERHFECREKLLITQDFGSTKRLQGSILHYYEQFKNAPEKKPFNIADYVSQRSKKPMRTSNPILDAPSFDRKW